MKLVRNEITHIHILINHHKVQPSSLPESLIQLTDRYGYRSPHVSIDAGNSFRYSAVAECAATKEGLLYETEQNRALMAGVQKNVDQVVKHGRIASATLINTFIIILSKCISFTTERACNRGGITTFRTLPHNHNFTMGAVISMVLKGMTKVFTQYRHGNR